MNWNEIAFDWNQVRAFLAATEEGSLSGAARALKQTQPTLSRQVSALEQSLGVTLFERSHRNLILTDAGLELVEHVRAMGEAAKRISMAASGQAQNVEGQVCITASELMATYCLPSILRKLRAHAPGITVKIVASDLVNDLIQREADIAIRHSQPVQPNLIARRVGFLEGGLFAARRLLSEVGVPRTPEDLMDKDFIGIEETEKLVNDLKYQGIELNINQFRARTSNGCCMLELVREGLGFGFLPKQGTEQFEDLVNVLPEFFKLKVPVWLVSHRELRTSRRIRVTYDLLAEELEQITDRA